MKVQPLQPINSKVGIYLQNKVIEVKSAILLLGFNRTDYFSQVLASLEKNQAAYEHDLHVYVDGGPDARQAEIKQLIANSKFPDATIVCRANNLSLIHI